MAQVFKNANRVAARAKETQRELDHVTIRGAAKADAILAEHEDTGASYIEWEKGRVDRFVILNDERGLGAAMSIEFGRKLSDGRRTTPVYALHDAMGLAHD